MMNDFDKTMTAEKTNAPGADTAIYTPGISPERDAWQTAFFIENHLDHFTHPEHAASPEQIRFMVFIQDDERYYPCSSRMFHSIMSRRKSDSLSRKYRKTLERIMALIAEQIEDEKEREFLEALIRIKYDHEIRDQIMIPSRLEKRLLMIFLNRTRIEDPYREEKELRNRRVSAALNSKAFLGAMNSVQVGRHVKIPRTLSGFREMADDLELRRLIALSSSRQLWETNAAADYTESDYLKLFKRPMKGSGADALLNFLGIGANSTPVENNKGKRILWLANESGEIILDLAIIKTLVQMGHKVILSLKEGPLFTKVDFSDALSDSVLARELEGALLLDEKNLSKNDLVKHIRSDYSIIVISDGTRENLNLLLASTTFARAFKEVDGIISRGGDQKRRFFDTPFQFTQDVYSIAQSGKDGVEIAFKPRHPRVIKFSYAELEKKARSIIGQMADAKERGMTTVFYSGIVGSIPGKVKIAKMVMSTFIRHLKEHSEMTFIINPSEFFEPGMDADDLMYMWEIVQRSGLIDIWRFQTYEDIAQAFKIMGNKVPPEWVGKDATFSTGCTKEMKIAIGVQKIHPEMQIIGPAYEKFMRRREYGIGKMYDKRLKEVY